MQSRKIVDEIEKENNDNQKGMQLDPASALQQFLDHIPITSIPAINTKSLGNYFIYV